MVVNWCGLTWSGPRDFRQRASFQQEIPEEAGFYAFTDCEFMRPGTVLYVGASLNLRSRVPKYDIKTLSGDTRGGTRHAGMTEIRNWQTAKKPIFVWWSLFPALKKEKELVSALVPRFNDLLTNEVWDAWKPG